MLIQMLTSVCLAPRLERLWANEGIFTVKDGRSDFVPVTTGISDDLNIEIFEALGEDITIVIGPFRTLRDLEDSTKVKIVKERDDLS